MTYKTKIRTYGDKVYANFSGLNVADNRMCIDRI